MINRHTGELNLRALSVMLLVVTFMLCSMMIVFAEDENTSGLTIYNTRIITNNTDATYIEGEVADAHGQEIVVTNAYYTPIARKARLRHQDCRSGRKLFGQKAHRGLL